MTGKNKDHRLVVIVRFPSVEKINEWYGSEDYQPLVPLRNEAADMKMVSYEILS